MKLLILILALILLIPTCSAEVTSPQNYSANLDMIFNSDMSFWDFLEDMTQIAIKYVGATIFWGIILLIPFISMYGRQNGLLLIMTTYMFIGGSIAAVMPTELVTFAKSLVVLIIVAVIYKVLNGKFR